MRITITVILAASFAAGSAWAAQPPAEGGKDKTSSIERGNAAANSSGPGLKRFLELSRHSLRGSRKLHIVPAKQAEGIRTGLIMAYGHIIPPPYKIDWEGSRLIVNGVQVSPSLLSEQEPGDSPAKYYRGDQARSARRSEVKKAIQEIYQREKGTKSQSDIQKDIVDFVLKSSDAFINPTWAGEYELYVQEAETQLRHAIDLNQGPPPSESEKTQRAARARLSYVNSLQKGLRQGAFIMFYSSGGSGTGWDVRKQVKEIMNTPNLTRDQRVELLKERVFKNYDPALDVVDNYDAKEWKQDEK
ncbi:MAG: hypothetical protein HY924_00720 [Elusimicrobia bacterium]|nr:hypothetical protein [Elusimicrobiota bacterium]